MKVVILPDGITGREINPLGDRPNPDNYISRVGDTEQQDYLRGMYLVENEQWQQAESKLREFILDDGNIYEPNSIHEAIESSTGKIKIID